MNDSEFRPTHVAPLDGLPTWANPDPAEPSAWLDALLPVQVVDRRADWARIVCSNGWTAWADGRMLIALPDDPPAASRPPARTVDPRPLLAELEHTVAAYRKLVEDLAEGRIDQGTFRQRTAGLRIGVVVDGESAWLLDLDHDRWWYCRGAELKTYATVEAPPEVRERGAEGTPEPERDGELEPGNKPSYPDALSAPPPVATATATPTQVGEV